jgi:hypothetical protein
LKLESDRLPTPVVKASTPAETLWQRSAAPAAKPAIGRLKIIAPLKDISQPALAERFSPLRKNRPRDVV